MFNIFKRGQHDTIGRAKTGLYLHRIVQPGQTELFEQTFREWASRPDSRGAYSDLNCRDENGQTLLYMAAAIGDASLVRLLLNKGADANVRCNRHRSPLDRAVYNKDVDIIPALIGAGAELGSVPDSGYSALHYAAGSGKMEAMEKLLQAGADINSRSDSGLTPIDLAAASGELHAVKRLLEAGANERCLEQNEHQLLHLSVAAGDTELTGVLCSLHDPWDEIDLSELSNSERRHYEVNMLSVRLGASIQYADQLGRSAIHIAAGLGYADVLRIILEPGPGAETLANERVTQTGKSPLHFAIEANHEATIDILLAAGADPLQPDRNGSTPMELARTLGHSSLVQKFDVASSMQMLTATDKLADFASFLFSDPKPQGLPLVVPFLCSEDLLRDDCRGTRWLDYHTRKGWTLTDTFAFKRTDGSPHTREELSNFLQSWLFFGLLQTLFDLAGVKLNWRKLLYKDESGSFKITTQYLSLYLHEWSLRCHFHSSNVMSFIDKVLQLASAFVSSFSFESTVAGPNNKNGKILHKETAETVNPEVALSIVLLGWLLLGYRSEMRDKKVERLETHDQRSRKVYGLPEPAESSSKGGPMANHAELFNNTSVEWLYSQFSQSPFITYDIMLLRGWCKSDATILHTFGLGPAALYYMSRLDRKRPKQDHSACTKHKCTTHNIDETSYETQHVDPGCKCVMILADKDDITSAVMNGKIPVISICTDDASGKNGIRLEVKEQSSGYLAISHVWADGLGNPAGNSLPQCQLIRLKGLLKTASDVHWNSDDTAISKRGDSSKSVPFWLDTLCIPLRKPTRSKALRLLSNVYHNASATLVLDKEIMNTSASASSTELQARILMSTWMRRLWTLEEALLSTGRLIFQFSETCLRYPDDLHSADFKQTSEIFGDIHPRHLHDSIANCLFGAIPSTWDVSRRYELHRLNLLALGLATRTTSHASDEFTCLGSLLELDVEKISEASDEERPYIFYSQLGDRSSAVRYLSPSILFADGPRLIRPGFRWAPQSFLSRTPKAVFDLKFGRVRTDTYSSHFTADHAAGLGLHVSQTDDTDRADGLEPAYFQKLGLHVEFSAWLLDLAPTCSLDAPFAFTDVATDRSHMVWQVDGENRSLKETWADCARLAVLHHPAFDPWAVLVVVPYPLPDAVAHPASPLSGSKRSRGQYGIYSGLVRFTTWSPLLEDESNSAQQSVVPGFYCTAKNSVVKQWCIG